MALGLTQRKKNEIKGMELALAYFETYGRDMLTRSFARYQAWMAVGLVGEGSECFGFDDPISHDHDFGPGFCIWLPDETYAEIGPALNAAYQALPKEFAGFCGRTETEWSVRRTGVFTISGFYRRYTNCDALPQDNLEWFRIPERHLATATNGAVFMDEFGEFTRVRANLLSFYPQDVLRKKLAARVAVMAQSGQYNYNRCLRRGDRSAAFLACAEFVKSALSAIYLLNRRFMPFYKWSFRGTAELSHLTGTVEALRALSLPAQANETMTEKSELIENICASIGKELVRQSLSESTSTFLLDYCRDIMAGISDERLRRLHVMADFD
jgi:hypothetical protein